MLLFERMTGRESMGNVFGFSVMVLSEDHAIDLSAILGQTITIEVDTPEETTRYFNGYVVSFSMAGGTQRYARYRLEVRPWLWLLTLGSTSRVFQNMTVPEIVTEVFRSNGFTDFRESLQETYRTWEYSVQFRETHLNYVSRLMEQEGIYYFCEHADGKHTIVLADSPTAHAPTAGYEEVHYFQHPTDSAVQEANRLRSWRAARQMRSGAFSSSDYDFTRPKASLLARLNRPLKQVHADYEVYDYPGEYLTLPDGDNHVRVRLDQHQGDFEAAEAIGNVRGLTPGAQFTLKDHPREDQNRTYLVVSATYEIAVNAYESGGSEGEDFEGTYVCISSDQPFRPARHSPKPKVDGPQTATVVGKAGEEIWTDQYGRVKVQFHWDREGARDEKSSCWVRVAQVWAGAKWGAMHIPRIGQEVIVDFLEGDPDRPIVTGRVYNADNMPPYGLPDNKTQSGIKSRSTLGGGPDNFNEIRFEDKKGSEELFIQAEKDQNTKVKHNQSISVGADRSVSVGGNETISVTGTRSSTITKKETQTFKDDRQMTVTGTNTDEVTKLHTATYHAGRTETVEAKGDHLTVTGSDKTADVDGKYDITAKTEFQVVQAGINKILVKDEIILDNSKCQVDLKGGAATITAADSITFTCGGASIKLTKDGTVEITGSTSVKVDGGGAGVQLTAAGATMSGTKATVSGAMMTEITGGMVKIN